MAIKNQIQKISLTAEQQEKLANLLDERIQAAEEFHSKWEELHNLYLNQYLCKPDVEQKLTPWPGASNTFVPIGRVMQDGIMSQLHNAMFSNDPFMKVMGIEGQSIDDAELLSRFYGEYVLRKIVNLKVFGNQWNFLTCLDGTGVIKHRWDKTIEVSRYLDTRYEPRYVTENIPGADGTVTPQRVAKGYDSFVKEEVRAQPAQRISCCITDLSNIFIAPDTLPSEDGISGLQRPNCPWYYERTYLTKEALLYRRNHMGYENVDEALFTQSAKREPGERDKTARQYEGLGENVLGDQVNEVLEFYMPLVLPAQITMADGTVQSQSFRDENGLPEDCIITYAPATRKILRIVPLWRVHSDGRRPHIVNWYNQLPLAFYGQGVQAKMRKFNEATNSSFNMMIDAGHLCNMPFFFYSPSAMQGLLPEISGIMPGQGIPVGDPRGVQVHNFRTDQSWFLDVIAQLQVFAERDANINDLTQGRDIQKKGASSTARGAMMIMQAGQIAFGRLASMMVLPYEELFRAIHAEYRRHAPEILEFNLPGSRGLKPYRMRRDALLQDMDFEFVLNPNTQAEVQLNQSLFEAAIKIPYIAQEPRAVRAAFKQLYISSGKKNFDEIWPEELTVKIETERAQAMQMQAAQAQAQAGQAAQQPPTQPGGQPPAPPSLMPPQAGGMPPELAAMMAEMMRGGQETMPTSTVEEPAMPPIEDEDLGVKIQ